MIRLTATQLVTALAAVAFLFIQVVVLEIRSGGNARAKMQERLAHLEAKDAAQDERILAGFSTGLAVSV